MIQIVYQFVMILVNRYSSSSHYKIISIDEGSKRIRNSMVE